MVSETRAAVDRAAAEGGDRAAGDPAAVDASALTCRILPFAEWARLQNLPPFQAPGLPDDPETWMILVVERQAPAGPQVVGTCSLFTALHWDCWWVDPAEPGAARGVVLRQLLRAALRQLAESEVRQAYTGAESDAPEVAALLTRFGFHPAAGKLFVLRVPDVATAVAAEKET